MSQSLKSGNSILRFLTVPHPHTLHFITAKINAQEKRDRSARSAFHWQLLKCRMLIFTLGEIIACPSSQTQFEIFVIISKTDFEHGGLQTLLEKLDMKLLGPTDVNPNIYERCLKYTVSARISPSWNPIGDASLAKGRDFLDNKPFGTVHVEYKIVNTTLTLNMQSCYVRMPRMTMSYLGFSDEMLERAWSQGNAISDASLTDQWVYVLPSLKKGRVMAVWKIMPPSCPYKTYKELKRHWKNAYGYRLPETDENMLFFEIYFRPLGSTFFTYPDVCVRPFYPRSCRPVAGCEDEDLAQTLLNDMNSKIRNVCGSPFTSSLEQARVTMDILPAKEVENNNTLNQQLLPPRNNTAAPFNKHNQNQQASVNSNLISLCTPTQNNISYCDLYDLPSTARDNPTTAMSQLLNENDARFQDYTPNNNYPNIQNDKPKFKPKFNPKKQITPVFIPYSTPMKNPEAKVLPFVPMFNKANTYSDEIFDIRSTTKPNNQGQNVNKEISNDTENIMPRDMINDNSSNQVPAAAKFIPLFNDNKSKAILKENNAIPKQNSNTVLSNQNKELQTSNKLNEKKPTRKPKSEPPELFTKNLLSGAQKLELATVVSLQKWLLSQGIRVPSRSRKPELVEKCLQILRDMSNQSSNK